ncbi:MAG: pilin [bacterium]|nr:pilin [bacterium]
MQTRIVLTKISKNLTATLALLAMSAQPVFAQTAAWGGKCVGSEVGRSDDVATIQGLECLFANVFLVIIPLIGLAAFVMFLVGSFRWLTSGGDTKHTGQAKQTMTYAVIGIVVALSGFIILNLIANFTGVEKVKEFRIPRSNEPP